MCEKPSKITKRFSKVIIKYPSRLEAMAIDPSKIVSNNNLRYTPGQIDFCVNICKTITIEKIKSDNTLELSINCNRPSLVKHSAEIMRKALKFKDALKIDVRDQLNLRHCGLGSSSSLIAGVACAINELYGKPISDRAMVKYLAQNHGEEIDGEDNFIVPVQCIGGSAACGTHEGGLIILAGESVVVKTMNIPKEYTVVIGIPSDFTYPDSKYLMDQEKKNLHMFLSCGKKYGPIIAYRLFHECFPDMDDHSLKQIGNLIYDYRFYMGSIKNCSFVYPPLIDLCNSLKYLKESSVAEILTISSVGPGVFVITKNPDICEKAFQARKMKTIRTKIHNGRYEITKIT